ncbi:MAG: UPF0175 family protein [Fimbriimonadales bacterium]|nr:UPF0175 family protein [Fimbriimonadales bacterium]
MSVTISDEMLRAAKMSADEFRLETALWLYQQERLTLAQAARWAGMTRLRFQRALYERNAPIHYDHEELKRDWETVQELHKPYQ